MIVGEQEYRVAWLLPKQDFTVIINAHDSEYVDLCAISSSPNSSSERHTIIFTTERGYGDSQENGRRVDIQDVVKSGILEADLKISSKNAKRYIKKIWISNVPDKDGRLINIKAPLALDHNNAQVHAII